MLMLVPRSSASMKRGSTPKTRNCTPAPTVTMSPTVQFGTIVVSIAGSAVPNGLLVERAQDFLDGAEGFCAKGIVAAVPGGYRVTVYGVELGSALA
jgi:hypothetical protein